MRRPLVVDLRNVYRAEEMTGFEYFAVGRGLKANAGNDVEVLDIRRRRAAS
jgi:hypothetical protein